MMQLSVVESSVTWKNVLFWSFQIAVPLYRWHINMVASYKTRIWLICEIRIPRQCYWIVSQVNFSHNRVKMRSWRKEIQVKLAIILQKCFLLSFEKSTLPCGVYIYIFLVFKSWTRPKFRTKTVSFTELPCIHIIHETITDNHSFVHLS